MSDPTASPPPASVERTARRERTDLAGRLEERLRSRQARIGVIGLGYVGLPLSRAFCQSGFPVTGFDIDPHKIEVLARGESYIGQIPGDWIRDAQREGRFQATGDFASLRNMDAIVICVPTPLTPTREPDLSFVRETTRQIARHLVRGQLVVLESTTYPGTTREVVLPILAESGLQLGSDFFLAFSPEREDPGNRKYGTESIPKLVGGVDATSGRLASVLYSEAIARVVTVSDAQIAEAAKILENIYRSVNIALVNELKVLFDRMGIDVWEVIDAAATKPFGFQAFYPGPGLGGHCIPIDPFYLAWKARESGLTTRFIELAGEINTQMPEYVVRRLSEALDRRRKTICGSSGLIIGLSYKKDVDDLRESPALEILDILQRRGARMDYHDPHFARVPPLRDYDFQLQSVALSPELLGSKDFAVIVTDHSAIDWRMIVENCPLVVDTRNVTRPYADGRDNIVRA